MTPATRRYLDLLRERLTLECYAWRGVQLGRLRSDFGLATYWLALHKAALLRQEGGAA